MTPTQRVEAGIVYNESGNWVNAELAQELATELERVTDALNAASDCADTLAAYETIAKLKTENADLKRQVEELLQERNQLRVEIEKVKAERNKAAMVERRKYLPKLTNLRAQLADRKPN